jgi:hypothetical protein
MESYVYEGEPPPLMHDLMSDGMEYTGGNEDMIKKLRKRVDKLMKGGIDSKEPPNNIDINEMIETTDPDISKFIE